MLTDMVVGFWLELKDRDTLSAKNCHDQFISISFLAPSMLAMVFKQGLLTLLIFNPQDWLYFFYEKVVHF